MSNLTLLHFRTKSLSDGIQCRKEIKFTIDKSNATKSSYNCPSLRFENYKIYLEVSNSWILSTINLMDACETYVQKNIPRALWFYPRDNTTLEHCRSVPLEILAVWEHLWFMVLPMAL